MFDIFNIRKCREMRDEIESLTVRLSNEHRKYEKAKERLESAEVDIYNLKLERNNLSDENENLRKKLAEEVVKNDELSRQVCKLNADNKKVNSALDESLARRDELSREIEKLTAQNNGFKEKCDFLEKKIKRHNGYFDKESKDLKTVLYDLEKRNRQLKDKCVTFSLERVHLKERTKTLNSFREYYVDHVIKIALMMCGIKETFSKTELCKILDVSRQTLENIGINEVNHTKKSVCLVYSSADVKRFIMENKRLRKILLYATKHGKVRKKGAEK